MMSQATFALTSPLANFLAYFILWVIPTIMVSLLLFPMLIPENKGRRTYYFNLALTHLFLSTSFLYVFGAMFFPFLSHFQHTLMGIIALIASGIALLQITLSKVNIRVTIQLAIAIAVVMTVFWLPHQSLRWMNIVVNAWIFSGIVSLILFVIYFLSGQRYRVFLFFGWLAGVGLGITPIVYSSFPIVYAIPTVWLLILHCVAILAFLFSLVYLGLSVHFQERFIIPFKPTSSNTLIPFITLIFIIAIITTGAMHPSSPLVPIYLWVAYLSMDMSVILIIGFAIGIYWNAMKLHSRFIVHGLLCFMFAFLLFSSSSNFSASIISMAHQLTFSYNHSDTRFIH